MAIAQSVTGLLTPDTPFSQLTFDDRKHEARAILVRMFMVGLHPDDDPDALWNRLCDIGGLEQACLLAGGSQWHMAEKFDVIYDQHRCAADEGSILAEFQLGQYFATRDPATDIPRDEPSAREWLTRALANTSAEDDTIFGTAHYKRLAQDEMAKLDEPPAAATMPITAPEKPSAPALLRQGVDTSISPPPVVPITPPPTASPDMQAKRMAGKFMFVWMVLGVFGAFWAFYQSGYVPCISNPYLVPEARVANAMCPTVVPKLIRLLAVIASFGAYAVAAITAAFLLSNVAKRQFRAEPHGSGVFVKAIGVVLTLCSVPVGLLCLELIGNFVLSVLQA